MLLLKYGGEAMERLGLDLLLHSVHLELWRLRRCDCERNRTPLVHLPAVGAARRLVN